MQHHPLQATGKDAVLIRIIRLQRRGIIPASKMRKHALCLILLVLVCITSPRLIQPVRAAKTLYVPGQYNTIQQAVNNASNTDTILVSPGLYLENVVVPDTIGKLQIIGNPANPASTIVDGTSSGSVFRLDGNQVTLRGFKIRNTGNGYSTIQSAKDVSTGDQHVISNNIIETGVNGLLLLQSNGNTIANNTFIGNTVSGIDLEESKDNIISQNTIQQSPYGVKLVTSTGNNINKNRISQTSYGIHLSSTSTGNTMSFNQVSGQTAGIYISSDSNIAHHNIVTDSGYGIWCYNSKYAQIYYNNVTHVSYGSYGIRIQWSTLTPSYNNIINNRIFHFEYGWGIEVVSSNNNTFTGNWIQGNAWGISLSSSAYNTLYHNNFINNSAQATTNAVNIWDKNGNGNRWSDYTGSDANGNGIGDTPYRIIPGQDNYPLMRTWSEHDIEIIGVSSSTSKVNYGHTVNITVQVRNNANISVSETFTVTAKYNNISIGTKTVNNLAQGASQILTFNWSTFGVAQGNYKISATADPVPDELNTGNNNFSDGTVLITVGDFDHDGNVDGVDFGIFALSYGSLYGQPRYNPEADFDADSDIDGVDFGKFVTYYGKTW